MASEQPFKTEAFLNQTEAEKDEKRPSILDSFEKQALLFKKLEKVYNSRPDIQSFTGAMADNPKFADQYSSDAIASDLDYVDKMLAKIEEQEERIASSTDTSLEYLNNGFRLSEILQAMVVDRLNKHWFKDCQAIMTSQYDDLRVGIDAVMKHKEGGYLGASFDFTVSNQDKIINKKLEKQWENTTKGYVPRVKYFQDPDTDEKRNLVVPKFIIGASRSDVEELAEAYLTDNMELLDNHPFKYVMLKQIEEQLQTVLDYLATDPVKEKHDFIIKQYDKIQQLLRILQNEVHHDENMTDDLYKQTEKSFALKTMRQFRMRKQIKRELSDSKAAA